jgi:hypothetical protein
MTDRPSDPPPPPPPGPAAPLEYRAPGPEPKSQWVTDEHPGSGWLVGCLLLLTGIGAVASVVLGVVWFLMGC